MMKEFTKYLKAERSVYIYSVLIITFILNSCVSPFGPNIEKYDNILVVEGLLTNQPGSCKVSLSHTYPYDRTNPAPESGALITLIDNAGNEIRLMEDKKGVYTPEDTAFYGIIGLSYKITIETALGESYESEFEELKKPIEIGSIQYDAIDKGNGLTGVQLNINSYDPSNKSHYYAWDFVETWQIEVPFQSANPNRPPMKICYNWNTSNAILIKSTKDFLEDRLVKFPFYFVDNRTNRLYFKYSILLKQYVLNEKTYMFYRHLKEINENVGSLYDKIPGFLVGNMRNTGNPENPVLGNFQVSGVSEKRLFIHNKDLPYNVRASIPYGYEFCRIETLDPRVSRPKVDSLLAVGWTVMDTLMVVEEDYLNYVMVISNACFDCRLSGEIKMPSFWMDDSKK